MTRSPLETLRDIELRAAEDQLRVARERIESARQFIHNERWDYGHRAALAEGMDLPLPTPNPTRMPERSAAE